MYLNTQYISLLSLLTVSGLAVCTEVTTDPNVPFYLALRSSNLDHLQNRLTQISDPLSPEYGHWLSQEQVRSLTATPDSEKDLVRSWLQGEESNDPHMTIQDLGDALYVQAPLSRVQELFQIQLYASYPNDLHRENKRDKQGARVHYSSDTEPTIPEHLQEIIQVVEGLWLPFQVHRPKSKFRSLTNTLEKGSLTTNGVLTPSTGVVGREVFSRIYNFSLKNAVDPKNTSVCAMEFLGDSGFNATALKVSQIWNGMSPSPLAKNHTIGHDYYADMETALDLQMISDLANQVDLWYWDSDTWILGWALNFTARTNAELPQIVSLSWGWSETNQCSLTNCKGNSSEAYVNRTNVELMKISARGITIVVASGDAGSPGRTDEGCKVLTMNPVFPGSSPWVLSVGATYLSGGGQSFKGQTPLCQRKACNLGTQEQGTTYMETGWTSGAGFGWWNERPKWQRSAVASYMQSGVHLPNTTYWNQNGRGYPDVSAIGHNCAVHILDRWGMIDGTSCAAPVWAGILAQINDHQTHRGRPRVGYVNPLLYHIYEQSPSAFNDVLVGNSSCTEDECCNANMGFAAAPGWDPVGGLGTPNLGRIIAFLDTFA